MPTQERRVNLDLLIDYHFAQVCRKIAEILFEKPRTWELLGDADEWQISTTFDDIHFFAKIVRPSAKNIFTLKNFSFIRKPFGGRPSCAPKKLGDVMTAKEFGSRPLSENVLDLQRKLLSRFNRKRRKYIKVEKTKQDRECRKTYREALSILTG